MYRRYPLSQGGYTGKPAGKVCRGIPFSSSIAPFPPGVVLSLTYPRAPHLRIDRHSKRDCRAQGTDGGKREDHVRFLPPEKGRQSLVMPSIGIYRGKDDGGARPLRGT